LAVGVNLDKGFDAGTKLGTALEFLGSTHGVTFVINDTAFRDEHPGDDRPTAETDVILPKMSNVALKNVLRLLLDQVHGTYRVRGDFIEVLPAPSGIPEDQLEPDAHFRQRLLKFPVVDVHFDHRPLSEAMEELAATSGANVLLDMDEKVAAVAKAPVTASLDNVPVDTAVRLLADMSGLVAVTVDNVLYVTTRENAKNWKPEPSQRHNLGLGLGGMPLEAFGLRQPEASAKEQPKQESPAPKK
jgi:hypothetical protein